MSVGFIYSSYPQRLRHFCSAVSSSAARIGVPPVECLPLAEPGARILVEWDAYFHLLECCYSKLLSLLDRPWRSRAMQKLHCSARPSLAVMHAEPWEI